MRDKFKAELRRYFLKTGWIYTIKALAFPVSVIVIIMAVAAAASCNFPEAAVISIDFWIKAPFVATLLAIPVYFSCLLMLVLLNGIITGTILAPIFLAGYYVFEIPVFISALIIACGIAGIQAINVALSFLIIFFVLNIMPFMLVKKHTEKMIMPSLQPEV